MKTFGTKIWVFIMVTIMIGFIGYMMYITGNWALGLILPESKDLKDIDGNIIKGLFGFAIWLFASAIIWIISLVSDMIYDEYKKYPRP